MEYKINPVPAEERRPKPKDESKLGFGKIYSDHMFTARWTPDEGWHDATVGRYA
nr:branched chain amino acid aminotransferase [Gammaproteobacteria bacterium]